MVWPLYTISDFPCFWGGKKLYTNYASTKQDSSWDFLKGNSSSEF